MAQRTAFMDTAKGFLSKLASAAHRIPENTQEVFQTVVLGVSSAGAAVAFLLATNFVFSTTFLRFSRVSPGFFMIASLAVIMATSLVVGLLLNTFEPDAAGSGIPQLKAAYWKEVGYVRFRTVLIKFVAGVLSLGGGTSLGREGPTVYIGGGLASVLAGLFGYPKRLRRGAMVVGAASGLAAAFNTPLAAITFVLEEIIGDINSRAIGRVVLASVIGAFIVYATVGRQPAFILPDIENVSWEAYLVYPLVAIASSLAGVVFQMATLTGRERIRAHARIPGWLHPCCGGFLTWVVGVICFELTGKTGVFGLGYHDLSEALSSGGLVWWVAGVLVAGKLIAFIASYSFGGCGGIFSPGLFIGGMTGFFLSGIAGYGLDLSASDKIAAACVGMTAFLCTTIRAPLTSLLIVFEMTHQFALVPGLMIAVIIAKVISRLAGRLNFYDALLISDGHELIKIRPPLDIRAWQSLPVSAIATGRPVVVTSLERTSLGELLARHPYNAFPVVLNGSLEGIATRRAIEKVLEQGGRLEIEEAVTCHPDQSVREIADRFIESPSGVMVVVDKDGSTVVGIITLHDLLRAQASIID